MTAFERRSFLFAATGAFVFGAATPALRAATSPAIDLERPEDALVAMMRIQHRLDGRDAPWWYFGRIYGMLPGRAPVPLFRYEGLEIGRVFREGDEYGVTGVTTSFFLDWQSKERLERFENPVSGEVNVVRPNLIGGRPGFVAAWYSVRGVRPGRVAPAEWKPDGLHISWDRYGDSIWLSHDRSYSPGVPQPAGESSVARAAIADVLDTGLGFVPASFSSTYFAPWPAWMEMEGRPGYVIWHADGMKLESVDRLPTRFRRWMEDGYGDRLRTPPEVT